jgi:hypothetical protein
MDETRPLALLEQAIMDCYDEEGVQRQLTQPWPIEPGPGDNRSHAQQRPQCSAKRRCTRHPAPSAACAIMPYQGDLTAFSVPLLAWPCRTPWPG